MAASITAKNAPKVFRKTFTFSNAAGSGAVGTIAVATMTGAIFVQECAAVCTTDLTGASATIELGVASDTACLIAQTTATNIDANMCWAGSTPDEGMSTVVNQAVKGDLIFTVGTAAITAGVITLTIYYKPLTFDGFLS